MYACVHYVIKNIRVDMEDRWVTNLIEDRKNSVLCRVSWTHTQKRFRSVTTSTSPHPGKTMSSVIFRWTWKVFTYSLLREKWKTRMDKSSIVVIWTNSWVWVPYSWISTCPLSKGKPVFKRTCTVTCESPERFFSRVGLVQTDLCGNLSGHWPDVV
jgi:cell wall-associated NlpC family hydrolase